MKASEFGRRPGHVVEVRSNLPSRDLTRGVDSVMTSVEGDRVRLVMADGAATLFRPRGLARCLVPASCDRVIGLTINRLDYRTKALVRV